MTPSDDLFQLIKSLTPSEKRYFKIWASRHVIGKKNNYEKLFDAFEKLPEDEPYDESVFKKSISKKMSSKYFADEKKNLEELIMKSMRSYNADKSIDSQLNDLLLDEDFYNEKRMNNLRKKTIEKAKNLSYKYEKFELLLKILDKEQSYRLELKQEELVKWAEDQQHERSIITSHLSTLAQLSEVFCWLFLQVRINPNQTSSEIYSKADSLIHSSAMQEYKNNISFRGDFLYFRNLALYHRLRRNWLKHLHYSKSALDLFEDKYPYMKIDIPRAYQLAQFNYLNACHWSKKYDDFESTLKTYKSFEAKSPDEAGELWQNCAHLELLWIMNTGRWNELNRMAHEIDSGIKKYAKKVNAARKLVLWLNLATGYFITENWTKANEYKELLLTDSSDSRRDLKNIARILELIFLYELNQPDLLDYKLRNTERYFIRHHFAGSIEKKFFGLITNLLKVSNNKEKKASLASFKNYLSLTRYDDKTKFISALPEIEIWVKAREENRTLISLWAEFEKEAEKIH